MNRKELSQQNRAVELLKFLYLEPTKFNIQKALEFIENSNKIFK